MRLTTMSNLSNMIDAVIQNEGGYQNKPNDTGNFYKGQNLGTKYGITPEFYKNATGKEPTKETIKNLTEEKARKLYEKELKYVAKIEDPDLRENVFDMVINAGPTNAAKVLQQDLGIEADGIIGTKTAEKIKEVGYTSHDYAKARINYYKRVSEEPNKSEFREGWINRASQFLDPKRLELEKAQVARTFPQAMQ